MDIKLLLFIVLFTIPILLNISLIIRFRKNIHIADIFLGIALFIVVTINYRYVFGVMELNLYTYVDYPEKLIYLLIPLFFIMIGFSYMQSKKIVFIYALIHTLLLTLPFIIMDSNYLLDNIFTNFFYSPFLILIMGGALLYDMIAITVLNIFNNKFDL